MKKTGRPPRKDNPKRICLNLSERAFRQLERLSRYSPSRSAFVETLLEVAAKPGAAK